MKKKGNVNMHPMKSKTKTVFAMNYASHYREVIYKKINDELNADFYFGNPKKLSIKKLDFDNLSNFRGEFNTLEFGKLIYYIGINKLVFSKKYDNIVLSGEPRILNNWIILFFAKITGKKVYFWSHGWLKRTGKARMLMSKLFFNLSYKVFLYSDYAKDLMIAGGISAGKLITVYNSLDYDTQFAVRNTLEKTDIYQKLFQDNNPVILFIGRVQKNKNLEQILDAMLLLKDTDIKYNFVVIGKEEVGYNFTKEISARGLDKNVWMYGPCYNEEIIGNLIYNADVCVSPGAIGLTAIHSLMYGTPVITHSEFAYQGPELEAIRDGYNGAFFKKDNIEDLSHKIKEVVKANYPKEQCWEVVDKVWNPHNQIKIFKKELLSN